MLLLIHCGYGLGQGAIEVLRTQEMPGKSKKRREGGPPGVLSVLLRHRNDGGDSQQEIADRPVLSCHRDLERTVLRPGD
jgi:hypothetical protein